MALHLEISEIRLARKADGTVQHLSSGNLPLAAFEVTPEARRHLGRLQALGHLPSSLGGPAFLANRDSAVWVVVQRRRSRV